MRKLSREALESRVKDLERDLDITRAGLQCAVNREVRWLGRVTVSGTRVRFGVAELTRAHGGLFLMQSSVKQSDGEWDRPYTAVRYLEDARAEWQRYVGGGELDLYIRQYIDTAMRRRNAALAAECSERIARHHANAVAISTVPTGPS